MGIRQPRNGKTETGQLIQTLRDCASEEELEIIKKIYGD